jgi:hypothetical protein
VRSYSIYKHDTTLKMTFGANFFLDDFNSGPPNIMFECICHSQEFAVHGLSQHLLCFAGSFLLLQLMLGEAFHVVLNCLNSVLDQAQINFNLYFLEVEERHPVVGVILFFTTMSPSSVWMMKWPGFIPFF